MSKINFIIHFFLEILQESCNLIGQKHFGPKLENQDFARYRIGGEISITVLVFTSDHFQEKLITKFFKKSKIPYCGAIFGPFCPNLDKNWFFWKKGLCQFVNITIIYHSLKIRKKLMTCSWEKCWTDGLADSCNFIEPSVGQLVQKDVLCWFFSSASCLV